MVTGEVDGNKSRFFVTISSSVVGTNMMDRYEEDRQGNSKLMMAMYDSGVNGNKLSVKLEESQHNSWKPQPSYWL